MLFSEIGDFVKADELVAEIETDKVCIYFFKFIYLRTPKSTYNTCTLTLEKT